MSTRAAFTTRQDLNIHIIMLHTIELQQANEARGSLTRFTVCHRVGLNVLGPRPDRKLAKPLSVPRYLSQVDPDH